MLTCRRATERISRSLDGPLPAGERIGLGVHFILCVHCRQFRRQVTTLDIALRAAVARPGASAEDVRLSDAARDRIAADLDRLRSGGG